MFKWFGEGSRKRGGKSVDKDADMFVSGAVGNKDGISDQQAFDSELIAVITAAIAAISADGGLPFRVVSFRRTSQASPAWNLAGRQEYLLAKM